MEDGEDVTEQILSDKGYTFLLVSHQLDRADESSIDLINELYDYCLMYGYGFYALTSSGDEDIQRWREETGAEYPFCLVDNITLKTMIRSNPGVMLLKEGTVIKKWSVNNLPDEYELGGSLDTLPIGKLNSNSLAYKVLWVLAWFVFPLLVVCMADLLWERYKKRKQNVVKE